jgi:hypothetical protein
MLLELEQEWLDVFFVLRAKSAEIYELKEDKIIGTSASLLYMAPCRTI